MRALSNPIGALRLALFALMGLIAGIAIVDASLALVLVLLGMGPLVLILPLVVIHYDEHEELLRRKHPG